VDSEIPLPARAVRLAPRRGISPPTTGSRPSPGLRPPPGVSTTSLRPRLAGHRKRMSVPLC